LVWVFVVTSWSCLQNILIGQLDFNEKGLLGSFSDIIGFAFKPALKSTPSWGDIDKMLNGKQIIRGFLDNVDIFIKALRGTLRITDESAYLMIDFTSLVITFTSHYFWRLTYYWWIIITVFTTRYSFICDLIMLICTQQNIQITVLSIIFVFWLNWILLSKQACVDTKVNQKTYKMHWDNRTPRLRGTDRYSCKRYT